MLDQTPTELTAEADKIQGDIDDLTERLRSLGNDGLFDSIMKIVKKSDEATFDNGFIIGVAIVAGLAEDIDNPLLTLFSEKVMLRRDDILANFKRDRAEGKYKLS